MDTVFPSCSPRPTLEKMFLCDWHLDMHTPSEVFPYFSSFLLDFETFFYYTGILALAFTIFYKCIMFLVSPGLV